MLIIFFTIQFCFADEIKYARPRNAATKAWSIEEDFSRRHFQSAPSPQPQESDAFDSYPQRRQFLDQRLQDVREEKARRSLEN